MNLGRIFSRFDPRTFLLKSVMDLPVPPPARDWTDKMPASWNNYANDTIGDCTCASMAYLMQLWTSQTAQPFKLTTTDVINTYSAVAGYDPSKPDTDRGAQMLDVLNYVRTTGIAGRKIGAFVKLDHNDIEHVKAAIDYFGGVYVGASLPLSARNVGKPWQGAAQITSTADQPGSWGGHALGVGRYDRSGLDFLTWGKRQTADWQWWLNYVDEAYAIISPDWLDPFGNAPVGLPIARLRTMLNEL